MHRPHGETTKRLERSHVPTRDRLRSSRGLKALETGQRFFESFEAVRALYQQHACWTELVPDHAPARATPQARARAVVAALTVLGGRLTRARVRRLDARRAARGLVAPVLAPLTVAQWLPLRLHRAASHTPCHGLQSSVWRR